MKKLILHPIRFLLGRPRRPDSSVFVGTRQGGNLFVVSHLNQLMQVQSLIRFERFRDNRLLILSTPANKVMPRTILENVQDDLFEAVAELPLPRSPNVVRVDRLSAIARLYRDVLRQSRPDNVFLLSFERHYAILGKFAVDQGARLFLVEEGTATYKIGQDGQNLAHIDPKGGSRLSIAAIRHLPFYADLRPALGRIERFSEVYAAFPALLQHAFQFERSTRFFMHAGGLTVNAQARKLVARYGITSRDALFVSQRYPVRDDILIGAIMEALASIARQDEGRIFLKLHPKDRPSVPKAFADSIRRLALDDRIVLLSEADFLIEPAIAIARPRAVYGLTSTTLVYAPLVSQATQTYSLLPWVVANVKAHPDYAPSHDDVSVMESHFSILAHFKHVRVLDGQTAFEQAMHAKYGDTVRDAIAAFWLRCAERDTAGALMRLPMSGPDFLNGHLPCVTALAGFGSPPGAWEDRLVSVFPDDLSGRRLACGIASWCRGDFDSAVASLDCDDRAAAGMPTGYARVFLASALRLAGQDGRAGEILRQGPPEDLETPFALYELAQLSRAEGNTDKFLCYLGWAYPGGTAEMPAEVLRQYAQAMLDGEHSDRIAESWQEYARRLEGDVAPDVVLGDTFEAMYAYHHRRLVASQGIWAGLEQAQQWLDRLSVLGLVAPATLTDLRMERLVLSENWAACRDEMLRNRESLSCSPRYRFLAMYAAIQSRDPAVFEWISGTAFANGNREAEQVFGLWQSVLRRDWNAVLEAAAIVSPTRGVAHPLYPELACAQACRELGDYKGAKRWLIAYQAHSKGEALGLIELVRLTQANGQWARTVQYLERVYREVPNMPDGLLLAYLDCLAELKQWDKAGVAMEASCVRLPAVPGLLARLVHIGMASGRYEEVCAQCEQVSSLPPDVAWQYAQVLRVLGRTADAHGVICKAGRPALTVEEWALRAEVCLIENLLQEACDCYQHMMRHFPNTRVLPLQERWFNARLLLAVSRPVVAG